MPIVLRLITAVVLIVAVLAFVIARKRAEHCWKFSRTQRDTEPKPWILRVSMPRSPNGIKKVAGQYRDIAAG